MISKLGLRGAIKSLYYSQKHTHSAASIIFHSKVITDIHSTAVFNVNNRLAVGVSNPGASHPRISRSVFTVKSGASVSHTGDNIGKIGPSSVVHVEGDLAIGDSYINSHARILCGDRISIGDGCAIAWGIELLDDDRHVLTDSPKTAPIRIENDVWIGHDVSIGKGVKIGEGAVIASNSVVRSDVPARSLFAGCPAKQIRQEVEWKQ